MNFHLHSNVREGWIKAKYFKHQFISKKLTRPIVKRRRKTRGKRLTQLSSSADKMSLGSRSSDGALGEEEENGEVRTSITKGTGEYFILGACPGV